MSIKTKFEKINLEKLKSDSPQAYNILNGWATSTKNFTDDTANEVVEPLFNKLYDKLASGKFWYVIEGNKQPSDQVAEPITKKEEVAIVKEVIKSEPIPKKKDEPKTTKAKDKATKTHTPSTKPKHTPTPPKMDGKSVFEIAKELRAKDSTLTQKEAVKKAGQMVKDAHRKVKDDELQALMKMIKSDPAYSVLKPEKNTSIIRDLGRPAIRTSKRVSKKGWKNQYGASEGGRTYYENRVNRMDVNKVPMYANGGNTSEESNLQKEILSAMGRSNVSNEIDPQIIQNGKSFEDILETISYEYSENEKEKTRVKSAIGRLIAKGYLKKGGLGYLRTSEGRKYLINSSFGFAKGGDVKGKMSFEEFEETLQEYEKEGGFGKTLEKGYIMNYLPKNDPYLNVKFNHRNKRKAYKQYLEMDKFAKGGRTYKSFTGRTSKETWGKENLYSKYDNNLDLIADVSDYFKELESDISKSYADEQKDSLIQVLKTGKLKFGDREFLQFAKGGSVHGKHLPTSEVEYARKLKIDKLVIDGKEVSEDDIVSGVFFKKFAKGGIINADEIFDLKVYNYSGKLIRSGKFVIDYQNSKIQFPSGKVYDVEGSNEYSFKILKTKIKAVGGIEGFVKFLKEISENSAYSSYAIGFIDKYAKGGKVGKFDAYEVQEKLADLSYGVWNKLNIDSGSEIYESDAIQKNMAKEYMMAGIDKMFLEYNAEQRKEIAEVLTDENQHSLRNYLALRGYLGEDEKADYVRLANKYNVGKKRIFLNPANITNTPSNSSATSPKAGSKAGYFYVPKSEIVSIDYTKDGESHTAKNTDILDGAYVKISALKYAKGGRLPNDEVVYVPKAEIEEIMVTDSGFKVKDVTEELLSGIHLKALALSPKSEPKKSSGTFGTTRIYKGYNGWIGRTSAYNVDGTDYEITTMKRSNGKLWSNAQEGKFENGMFTYMVFQSPNINLIETKPSKVTEKAVSEQHDKAIAKFKEIKGL